MKYLKTLLSSLFVVSLLSLMSFTMPKGEGEATVKGEVVDLACYLGHGAKGEKHKTCAQNCINGGQPMGLLSEDGTVYLLLGNHDDMDTFNELKKHAAETVTVTGGVNNSGGMKSMEVDKVVY